MAKIGNLQVGSIKFANGTLAKYFSTTGGSYSGGSYSAITRTISDGNDRPAEVHCRATYHYQSSVGAGSATFLARLRRNRSGTYTTFMEYTQAWSGSTTRDATLNWSVVDTDSQDGDIWYFEVAITPQNAGGGTLVVYWNSRELAVKVSRF